MAGYVVALLASHHVRNIFSCGEPSLDTYLKQVAGQDVKRGLAVCYVLTEQGSQQVVGYYTLSATSVDVSALPQDQRKRSGRYAVVPAVLLGRLAVDEHRRRSGLGAALLADALQRALRTGVGVKLVVLDALNDAAVSFYEHHGFRRFADTAMRLFISLDTLRALYPDVPAPDANSLAGPSGEDTPPE